jgi:hypothetical protein
MSLGLIAVPQTLHMKDNQMIMIQQAGLKGSEIINHQLPHIDWAASVLEANKLMHKSGTAELLVAGEAGARYAAPWPAISQNSP